MLDQSANLIRNNVEEDISNQNHCKTTEMNPWLRDKLEKAEVLSIIEPFWTSSYKQVSFQNSTFWYCLVHYIYPIALSIN